MEELARLGAVELVDGMAIVSLVGEEMREMVGVSGAMLSVLGGHGVNIEMISQGMLGFFWGVFSPLFFHPCYTSLSLFLFLFLPAGEFFALSLSLSKSELLYTRFSNSNL